MAERSISALDAIQMTMSEFFAEVEEATTPKYFYTRDEFIEISPQEIGLGGAAALDGLLGAFEGEVEHRRRLTLLDDVLVHLVEEHVPPAARRVVEDLEAGHPALGSWRAPHAGELGRLVEQAAGQDVTVLVTGATGFVGNRLAERLLDAMARDHALEIPAVLTDAAAVLDALAPFGDADLRRFASAFDRLVTRLRSAAGEGGSQLQGLMLDRPLLLGMLAFFGDLAFLPCLIECGLQRRQFAGSLVLELLCQGIFGLAAFVLPVGQAVFVLGLQRFCLVL